MEDGVKSVYGCGSTHIPTVTLSSVSISGAADSKLSVPLASHREKHFCRSQSSLQLSVRCDVFSRFWASAMLAWFCTVTVCQSLGLRRTSTVKKSLITNQNIYTLIFIMFLANDDIQTDDKLKENKASWQVSSWVTICPLILHVSGIVQGWFRWWWWTAICPICLGKLLLKAMHYNIALLYKKSTYCVT